MQWGSPCSSERGWPDTCWRARCAKAAAGEEKSHAAAFAPFGHFQRCPAGISRTTPFYGALGMGGHRDCPSLCSDAGGRAVGWKGGTEQLFFCQAVAAHFLAGRGAGADDEPHVYRAPKGLSQALFPVYDIKGNRCKVNTDGKGMTAAQASDATSEPYLCLDELCGLCKCMCGTAETS